MTKSDWDVYGTGSQSIISESGSKRCQLSGSKWLLWNGRSDLTDCQITAMMRLYGSGTLSGGLILRANPALSNCYRFLRQNPSGYGYHDYYLHAIVGGTPAQLAYIRVSTSPSTWIKTRFRIDGWQISIDEWISGAWQQAMLVEDVLHRVASGYAGLIGASSGLGGSILLDDIEIAEKE